MGQNKNFEYNLPLQAYRADDGTINILNYMPRKNAVAEISLRVIITKGLDLLNSVLSLECMRDGTEIMLKNAIKQALQSAEGK
jgi:hypothetical protein